jgi:cell division protein FtsQ
MGGRAIAPEPASPLRKWVNRVVLVLGTALVTGGLYTGGAALRSQQVETLSVMGEVHHIDINAIEARLAPRLSEGFLATDLSNLRQELESLPWVYKVNTRKRWPSKIEVHLVEQRPLARWGDSGYLNHEGQFFAATPHPLYDTLPLLQGPDGSEASLMRRYQTLASVLEPEHLIIRALSLDELGQVSVQLDNGLALQLGSVEMLQRITRFRQLWRQELMAQTVMKVDLRYEHGAAVTFGDSRLAMQLPQAGGEG